MRLRIFIATKSHKNSQKRQNHLVAKLLNSETRGTDRIMVDRIILKFLPRGIRYAAPVVGLNAAVVLEGESPLEPSPKNVVSRLDRSLALQKGNKDFQVLTVPQNFHRGKKV